MVIVSAGAAAGIASGLAAGHLLKHVLFSVEPTDTKTFSVVFVLLAIVAITACLVPARGAVKITPAVVLRWE
jgi:hypothetical protein